MLHRAPARGHHPPHPLRVAQGRGARRNARSLSHRPGQLDEFIRIIRESNNREEAKIKLLAFDFTRQQVERIGIIIRSEARLTSGRYSFSEPRPTPSWNCASTN
jgi:hypothetical protein